MEIILTPDTVKYLNKRSINEITIDMKDSLCCLGAGTPEVYPGKQLDKGHENLYEMIEVSNINVFYFTKMDVRDNKITVKLSKFLFLKSLEVKGIEMY